MAAQAALPLNLTNDDIYMIFEVLDVKLNTIILKALIHGLYTGVLGVTLWSIFRSSTKSSSIGRCFMILVIIVLYVLATILLGELWTYTHHAFIDEAQNYFTVFMELNGFSSTENHAALVAGITSCISTFIADFSLIWRCWLVWGRRWFIIIIPVLCIILGTVFKSIQTYQAYIDSINDFTVSTYSSSAAKWQMSYLALTFITTIWCTIFILYRIVYVARSGHGVGIRSYHKVIEALVESAALYSAVLIVDIGFVARNILSGSYIDILGATIKGIAPTLLVGRVAAGHARPDDSWQESSTSTVSSLNFGTSTVSTQEGDISQSAELNEMDNLDPGQERSFGHIEEEARETRSLDIV